MLHETIALLCNPLANKKRIKKIHALITSSFFKKQISFESFTESWPAKINVYKEVWVIGGDGTLNYFLNFYKAVNIPIAIFKGGTGNDFAWKLYGDRILEEQIEKVLTSIPHRVDAAECNGQIFINGIGVGFDGEVLRSIHTIRFLGGHLGYLLIVLKKIFSFKEFDYKIEIDEEIFTGKFLLVAVTNSSRTGGGFMISPEAKINDGKLNVVLAKPLNILNRLRYLPIIKKGRHLRLSFIKHFTAQQIKIIASKKVYAQLDGELISAETFDIKILPAKYKFKY